MSACPQRNDRPILQVGAWRAMPYHLGEIHDGRIPHRIGQTADSITAVQNVPEIAEALEAALRQRQH